MQSSATMLDGSKIMSEDVWFGGLAKTEDFDGAQFVPDHHPEACYC